MHVVPLLLLINMMCRPYKDGSSRTVGVLGTAWSRVIGNGYGMGYGKHAEYPCGACVYVLQVRENI